MKILIRGAGDLATGIAAELWERGHQILMTDVAIPLTVRREVAFSRAVYEEHAVVEGIEAVLADNFEEAETKQSREKALDILKRYFDGTETQTAGIKERVFLKMQIKLSIMSKKMEEMVVSSIKKCMQEILQNIG